MGALGFRKNLVFPLPEPPTTSIFLFLAYLGFLGLPFMVSLSVSVKRMLFSNFSSTYGSISFEFPRESFCQVPFLFMDDFLKFEQQKTVNLF